MNTLPKEWSIYEDGQIQQEFTSQKTSRSQRPRTFKVLESLMINKKINLLDIGCGHANEEYKINVESLGWEYNGCDLFNQPKEININSILKCSNGNSDIVTVNNVLNTIKEKEVRISILNQCKNALNPETGKLFILIYEGTLSKEEKSSGMTIQTMTSKQTRDGWQNRWKTEKYLEEVKEVFPNAIIKSIAGVKLITLK